MMPTMELRWLEKEIKIEELAYGGDYYRTYTQTVKVLQQKWMQTYGSTDESGNYFTAEEWRDIPTEKL